MYCTHVVHIETKMSMSSKFYVRNQLVDCEEDFTHEFKGHKNICREDLPPWTQEKGNTDKASRRAVSRNLNAFLNTGKGGTVYLGVIDSGHVKGLQLSQYQKEHIIGSVRDVMSRYNPPVKRHRYKVRFTPVFNNQEEGKEIVNNMCKEQMDPALLERPHEFRSSNYCWCDNDNVMQYNAGILLQDYVIEISIRPWDPADPLNAEEGCGQLANIHPIHDDEEGNCYFRRQASIVKYTMTELAQLTRHEVQAECQNRINILKKEIAALQQKVGASEPE
ncbi:uncharacterized protein LOC128242431 [Mya arenaria]|uniref:uncharacterized protein LOC128242431 n=1 Tax=Mya arenaria TaxID=6604 RepID=UPI0022E69E8F|nr:uncharacterized protein LOC128242431 [Mya arenaria]